jgi:hypothetical protein
VFYTYLDELQTWFGRESTRAPHGGVPALAGAGPSASVMSE